MLFRKLFTATIFILTVACDAQNDPFNETEPVTASLVGEQNAIVPGSPFPVAVRLDHAEHWHTYWKNPGFPGLPTVIEWKLPPDFTASEALWPVPKVVSGEIGAQHLFEGVLYIVTDIAAPPSLKPGDTVTLEAVVSFLECEEGGQCIQRKESLKLSVPVASQAVRDPAQAAAFESVRKAQPVPTDAWKVSVTPNGALWTIRAEPGAGAAADPGKVYFLDAAAVISTDPQEWKKDGAALVLEIEKQEEESKDAPRGYLLAENSWLEGSKVLVIPAGAAAAPTVALPGPVKPDDSGAASTASESESVEKQIATIRSWGVRQLGDGGNTASGGDITWPLAILFAFLGGMILNLMPCVFPVLGIKVLGFVKQSGEDPSVVKKHGLVYALGVILSVLALTAVLLAVRAGSEGAGWGFQLQNPVFLSILITVVFAFSLSMSGVFELLPGLTSVGSGLQDAEGYKGSFFTGLLTVVLATPCTGPFMGPALGFALNADTSMLLVVVVFSSLAVGLALPYVVLSWFPALVRKLPRPGAWMETFKQFMSFPMYATVVWLVTVFASTTGMGGLMRILFALVFFAVALWLFGRFFQRTAKVKSRRIAFPLAILCTVAGAWTAWNGARQESPDEVMASGVVSFSPQTIIERRSKGLTTVVDCWAKWCLQCELNKEAAFEREAFKSALPRYNAIFMLGDKTKPNALVDKFLEAYKQGGIPYAIIYPPSGPAIEMPSIIPSPQMLIDGLEEAKKQGAGK